ncbi:TPM domain-containing protein [Butyrivibrio sp. AC2005]|uniref:TPM domain-containing protein n=1 Tax=Butyrivibrio sp. AC2005 TaxID=1280672 RepID=UPI00040D0EB7|nr:TPM domain-containing protein [Butyrivibrio sp. AC2005]
MNIKKTTSIIATLSIIICGGCNSKQAQENVQNQLNNFNMANNDAEENTDYNTDTYLTNSDSSQIVPSNDNEESTFTQVYDGTDTDYSDMFHYTSIEEVKANIDSKYPVFMMNESGFDNLNPAVYIPLNVIETSQHSYFYNDEFRESLLMDSDSYNRIINVNSDNQMILATLHNKNQYSLYPVDSINHNVAPFVISNWKSDSNEQKIYVRDVRFPYNSMESIAEINGNSIPFNKINENVDPEDDDEDRMFKLFDMVLDENIDLHRAAPDSKADGDYYFTCNNPNQSIVLGTYNDVDYSENEGLFDNSFLIIGKQVMVEDISEPTKEGYYIVHPEWLESEYVILRQLVFDSENSDVQEYRYLIKTDYAENSHINNNTYIDNIALLGTSEENDIKNSIGNNDNYDIVIYIDYRDSFSSSINENDFAKDYYYTNHFKNNGIMLTVLMDNNGHWDTYCIDRFGDMEWMISQRRVDSMMDQLYNFFDNEDYASGIKCFVESFKYHS